jgi:hypothetical protein
MDKVFRAQLEYPDAGRYRYMAFLNRRWERKRSVRGLWGEPWPAIVSGVERPILFDVEFLAPATFVGLMTARSSIRSRRGPQLLL